MPFLRPDADHTDGNWLTQADSATDTYLTIDETSADDADYVKSGASPVADLYRVRLSDPAGTVDEAEAVTVRYRYGKSGPDVINITVRLAERTGTAPDVFTTRASWLHSEVPTTLTTAAQALTAPQKSSIADWAELYLEIEASGGAALTTPVLLGTQITGTNTDVSSYIATNPAYSTGDLVIVAVLNDGGLARVGTVSITPPDSEAVTTEQASHSDGTSGTGGHTITLFSYVAAANRTAAANITAAITGGTSAVEQFVVIVQVFDAGTFNATTRLVNETTTFSTTATNDALSGAFTATPAQGVVGFMAATAFTQISATPPSGWTERGNFDVGALCGYAATRDLETTASESVAAATFTITTAQAYAAITFVVNPAGS